MEKKQIILFPAMNSYPEARAKHWYNKFINLISEKITGSIMELPDAYFNHTSPYTIVPSFLEISHNSVNERLHYVKCARDLNLYESFVGHSIGTVFSLKLAENQPNVKKIVLVSPALNQKYLEFLQIKIDFKKFSEKKILVLTDPLDPYFCTLEHMNYVYQELKKNALSVQHLELKSSSHGRILTKQVLDHMKNFLQSN